MQDSVVPAMHAVREIRVQEALQSCHCSGHACRHHPQCFMPGKWNKGGGQAEEYQG